MNRTRARRRAQARQAETGGDQGLSPASAPVSCLQTFDDLTDLHISASTGRIVETVLAEEGSPPESVFDFAKGIKAVARSKPQQDTRLVMEGKAQVLLEKDGQK